MTCPSCQEKDARIAEIKKAFTEGIAKEFLDSLWTDAYNMALKYQHDMEAAKNAAVPWLVGNMEYIFDDALAAYEKSREGK